MRCKNSKNNNCTLTFHNHLSIDRDIAHGNVSSKGLFIWEAGRDDARDAKNTIISS